MFSNFKTHGVPWQDGAKRIDDCQYLFATSVSEIKELTLGLGVAEAKVQDRRSVPLNAGQFEELVANEKPIELHPGCRVFEVLFERSHMVSYTVCDRDFASEHCDGTGK